MGMAVSGNDMVKNTVEQEQVESGRQELENEKTNLDKGSWWYHRKSFIMCSIIGMSGFQFGASFRSSANHRSRLGKYLWPSSNA
jgi:hypothetical protein